MDINTIRALVTLVLLLAFCGLILFVLLKGKDAYKDAAELPFLEDDNE
jgi:cbb3-type cytochrome oxidase subunit 3